QLLDAPLRHGDHGGARGQGDTGGAGLADHRPQAGIAGDRPLGVDDDELAGAHGVHGCGERTGRARGHAGDRDLTGGADDPTGGRDVEDLRLREVAGKATVVVDEVREGQRVDV